MKKRTPTTTKTIGRPKPKYKVGDLVQFEYAAGPVNARIVEYRGPIAEGGRHLYRVVGKQGRESLILELREERLAPLVRETADITSEADNPVS
jgi:hypothetical protein